MEEANEKCWRKEVDENLKRLHSLLFGAEIALDKKDDSSAHILGLRLLGFLDSHCQSDADTAFIRPIRRETLSMVDAARRSLTPDLDRYAFHRFLIFTSVFSALLHVLIRRMVLYV